LRERVSKVEGKHEGHDHESNNGADRVTKNTRRKTREEGEEKGKEEI
jgi:hypothetical protein